MFFSQLECFTVLVDIAARYCVQLTNYTVCQYSRPGKGELILKGVVGRERVGTAFQHLFHVLLFENSLKLF